MLYFFPSTTLFVDLFHLFSFNRLLWAAFLLILLTFSCCGTKSPHISEEEEKDEGTSNFTTEIAPLELDNEDRIGTLHFQLCVGLLVPLKYSYSHILPSFNWILVKFAPTWRISQRKAGLLTIFDVGGSIGYATNLDSIPLMIGSISSLNQSISYNS